MVKYLENIYKKYAKYIGNSEYVYKSCQGEWIVVMKKTENTQTNKMRRDIFDSRYAKYRASELLVVDIFNKYDMTHIKSIDSSVYRHKSVTYTIGNIVYPDLFDSNINITCSNGIHYYNTIDPAFYLDLVIDNNYTGAHKYYCANGRIYIETKYINGKHIG